MGLRHRVTRPNFDAWIKRGFIWLDAEWLTEAETQALTKLLPAHMALDARTAFMRGVNQSLTSCAFSMRTSPEGKQSVLLQKVAEQARALLYLLAEVELELDTAHTLQAFSKDLLYLKHSTETLSEGSHAADRSNKLQPHFWDTVQDIETVFSYAANQMRPSKQNRPKLNNARVLAGSLARAHFYAVGKWPAYTARSKNAWFLDFVAALPERLGVAPGIDSVKAGIKDEKSRFDAEMS